MFETCITILDDDGVYPRETVLCDGVGYACYKGIPLLFNVRNKEDKWYGENQHKKTCLFSAFFIMNREFPILKFRYHSSKCYIFIKSDTKPSLQETLNRVKLIVDGTIKLPILNHSVFLNKKFEEHRAIADDIMSNQEYINLCTCENKPFTELLEKWRKSYVFSSKKRSIQAVENYFKLFVNSSRLIHIALYYYNNAANLTKDGYSEDAGINLHLTFQAITKDYMESHLVKNKRIAIENLFETIWPKEWGNDYLDDLWNARNAFLAHIDEDMFTKNENIHDSDEYCNDTFESITYMITKYIRYKNNIKENG